MEELVRAFANVGLKCEVADKPLVPTAREIFQLDIKQKGRQEVFRVFQGSPENRAQVLGTDRDIAQLILMVHEPARDFDQPLAAWEIRDFQKKHGDNWKAEFAKFYRVSEDKIFKQNGNWFVKSRTTNAKRHFLLGRDERQMFIAQLTKPVSTVRDAHASLKTPTVTFAEGRARGRTKRQGEWFFVNLPEALLKELKQLIRQKGIVVLKKQALGAGGKPHIAEEFFIWKGERYARGAVRHPDHQTVKFAEWRRVIRNQEGATSRGGASGVNWID